MDWKSGVKVLALMETPGTRPKPLASEIQNLLGFRA